MLSRLIAAIATLAALAAGASAPAAPLSVLDSFRIGNTGTVYCSAQSLATDAALTGMFDTGYSVTCRDAALPVGKLYKIRSPQAAEQRLAAIRNSTADCSAPHEVKVAELGEIQAVDCRLKEQDVAYRAYQVIQGNELYAAEGLAGYDSALQLGLRSIVADRPIKGEVSIATTGAGDPTAFARVQAGTLDPSRALAEAYRRNNAGSYAEAAEFFAAVTNLGEGPLSRSESLANEALQKSNLGRYAEADSLFGRAAEQLGNDPLVARRLRNYRAIHELNQNHPDAALKELDKPMPKAADDSATTAAGAPAISAFVSKRLNSETKLGQQLAGDTDELSSAEKAVILDGQALQLRGTSLRLKGEIAQATNALQQADSKLQAVRDGRVESVTWMRAQILGDLAAIAEDQKNMAEANRLYQEGVTLLEANYPGSAALLNAKARLAGYLARTGQVATAEAMFREIVRSQPDTSNLPPSFADVLRPYVDLLLKKGDDPAATAEIFAAAQLMVRPGLAQTQAVLARELSGGTDQASRLFRQAVTPDSPGRTRADRACAPYGHRRLRRPTSRFGRELLKAGLDQSQKEQVATQAALASFPRYRAVSDEVMPLASLQKILRPGEAYYRMTIVGDSIYATLVTPAFGAGYQAQPHGQSALRSGPGTPRHDFDGRGWAAQDLSVRRRFVAPDVRRAVRPVRVRRRGRKAPDLRARRRDAEPAGEPARHGSGVCRCLYQARRRELRLPRNPMARARSRHQHLGQPALVRSVAKRAAVGREERISGPGLKHPAVRRAEGWCRPQPIATARFRCRLGSIRFRPKELQVASSILQPYDPGGGGRHRRRVSPTPRSRIARTLTSTGSSISRRTGSSPRAPQNARRSPRS